MAFGHFRLVVAVVASAPILEIRGQPLLLRLSNVVDNRIYTRKSRKCQMKESPRRAMALAVSLLLLVAPAIAAA